MAHPPVKLRSLATAFLALFLVPSFALAGIEASREEAGRLFDGAALSASIAPAADGEDRGKNTFEFLQQMKEVLSSGRWNGSTPEARQFMFTNAQAGWTAQAQSVGLEGFLWTKKELEARYGAGNFNHHLYDYFAYLDGLLKPVPWTQELRDALLNLKTQNISADEKNARLNEILETYVAGLQANIEKYDLAAWSKKARIYELFPRAYNLDGRREAAGFKSPADPKKTLFFRDFQASDFDVIKRMGFDTVWPMGILPIGVRGQTGTGGGSPYSISDHGTVNPDLGTEEDFKNFVKKAHSAGLKVIVDFVVNHTSLDSKLLAENPNYFVSFRYDGACPADGYFEHFWQNSKYCVHHGGFEYGGGVSSWIDTAQVNYSNQALRNRMTEVVKGWVTKFDVDGYRVDMAYLALNNVFARTWQKSMPSQEFYRQLIWTVKAAKPSAAFMAEAYAFQEDLSACGFDSIYSKYETARPEGQTGWYNATESGNAWEVQSSVNRAAFLAWQKGGAGSVVFVGNHDEAAPEKIYGKRLPAALMLTMLYPGSVMMYSSAEIGYDAAIPNGEQKPLPFSEPCEIDWDGGNPWVKSVYQTVLTESKKVRAEMGDYEMAPLWPADGGAWAGYLLTSKATGKKKAVIANVTWNGTSARIPGYGFSAWLEPGAYKIIDVK
ncbi:MAG: hypothetical protein A3J79_11210 [Elusimicrobia bacterium RIFOXYB2_FULL_62_6]|nr:MAG: hypothetical protein A3J79_11210 [Elusimicrobia bacterium RIFOXYB2_FULL_62_6]